MFERFTDRARKVMALANQEAQHFNHEYIGTEHILLGLVKEGSGVGATVLKNLGVDLKKLRREAEKLVQRGPDIILMGKLPNTPRAKQVIVYAIEEARALHHNYVGTEHILLGLLRETDGIAAQVLRNSGLKLEDVRREVLIMLGASPERENSERQWTSISRGHSRFRRFLNRARKWIRVGGEDPMYERFTDRARKVMALANQEAQRFNHEYIGTEHILLGLVMENSGVGATVLKNLGVDIKKLRLEVERLVKSGPDVVAMGRRPQTPRAKTAIMYAIEEARVLHHNYVGTEHVLLGLMRESEGIAAQVLMNLGLRIEEVRHEVLRLLGVAEGPAPAGAGEEQPGAASYKDMPVWQKADELAQQVYAATGAFPPEQTPGVASRLREMALAIPPHIAEAHNRPIPGEARWVLNAAFVSLRELRYLLDFAKRLESLKGEDHQRLAGLAEEIEKLLRSFYASQGH
jgi:four helix bundle protein